MTTGAIIAIVVVALVVLALLAFMLPRMRRKAEVRKRERELHNRRETAAEEQRAEATARERHASEAEQRARIAQREAESERARASLHEERAGLHERGMADHELIDDSERDRFAGTSAMSPGTDRREGLTSSHGRDGDSAGLLDDDYERGRRDEAMEERDRPARFDRDEVTDDEVTERGRRDAPSRY
jgi:hypothetical protein